MASDVGHFFISVCYLYVLIGEESIQVLCPFFKIRQFVFLVFSHMSSLYSLEIKPLSVVSLANMFSHIVGSFFILKMVPLAVQKLLNLMQFCLFSPLVPVPQVIYQQKYCYVRYLKVLLPIIYSRIFIFLFYTF